jgi:hypothetical protein
MYVCIGRLSPCESHRGRDYHFFRTTGRSFSWSLSSFRKCSNSEGPGSAARLISGRSGRLKDAFGERTVYVGAPQFLHRGPMSDAHHSLVDTMDGSMEGRTREKPGNGPSLLCTVRLAKWRCVTVGTTKMRRYGPQKGGTTWDSWSQVPDNNFRMANARLGSRSPQWWCVV